MSWPLRIASLLVVCGLAVIGWLLSTSPSYTAYDWIPPEEASRLGTAILVAAPTVMLGRAVGYLRLRRLIWERAPLQSDPEWAGRLVRAKNPEES